MGDKAHLSLMEKVQQNQGEQRKMYYCHLLGDKTADKITELDLRLIETTIRTVPKQG